MLERRVRTTKQYTIYAVLHLLPDPSAGEMRKAGGSVQQNGAKLRTRTTPRSFQTVKKSSLSLRFHNC